MGLKVMTAGPVKAKRKLDEIVRGSHLGGNGLDSGQWKNETVEGVFTDVGPFVPRSELETHLRSARPVKYDFIPPDESRLRDNGQCVVDQIDNIYGHLRSDLARARFIEACYEHKRGLDLDTTWDISQGVRVATLSSILRAHDISFHSFDILGKRFDKHISRSQPQLPHPSCITP